MNYQVKLFHGTQEIFVTFVTPSHASNFIEALAIATSRFEYDNHEPSLVNRVSIEIV